MEKIIHFTVPEKLTPVNVQTIELARKLHPTWEVKVWKDPMRPDGYPLESYWPKANSGAQLSDLLRLDVLYKWGGVYVDGDMRLLKPLDDLVEKFDFFIASHEGIVPVNALIGARKAHPALQVLIGELLLNEPDWSLPPDRTTGPDIFVRTLKWDRHVTVLPRETFFCYGPFETHSRKTHRHSYGEHLWEYSWKNLIAPTRPGLRSTAKLLMKPALISGLRILRRIKSLDRSSSEQQVCRQQKVYPVSDEIVLKTVHGFNIVVHGNDTSSTPAIIFGDYSEPREESFVKKTLRGGDWAISVDSADSNGVLFCMLAAQNVRSFGRVFAYAANPVISKLLSKSVVMNRMHDRVVIRPVAAGEIAGTVRLVLTPGGQGDVQVGRDEFIESTSGQTNRTLGPDDLAAIDVPSVTLDQEFPVDLPIKLLKIDARGNEIAVLKGAGRLLERRCVDFVLIKILREVEKFRWRRELGGVRWNKLLIQLNLLTESNYVACTLAEDGSLVEHKSVTEALDRSDSRYLVFMARDQYTFGDPASR